MMKLTREQIEAFKVKYPERYTALELEAKKEMFRVEAEKVAREALKIDALAVKTAGIRRFRTALVSCELPDPTELLVGVRGLVTQRSWHVSDLGDLRSTVKSFIWKQVAFADHIPTENNNNGLYCRTLSPVSLMFSGHRYHGDVDVEGIIECRGTVVQHSDGIVRTEWARILCIIIVGDSEAVYEPKFAEMRYKYFPIPIYVLTLSQYAEFLFRLMFALRIRR